MKTFVVLAVIIGSRLAAPTETFEDIGELLKAKKSSNGAAPLFHGRSQPAHREEEHIEDEHKARAYLESPLGSLSVSSSAYGPSLSANIGQPAGSGYGASGSYAPAVSNYGVGASSISLGGGGGYSGAAASGAGAYSAPSAALNTHVSLPGAGSGYSGASVAGYGASGLSGAHGVGSAIGVFPNAHVGGCNVPLLLSCAPNVVAGHLQLAHPHSYAAPAYRSFDEAAEKEAEWAQARMISHHKISEDFPEKHPGNHHVVSQDYPEPNVTRFVAVQKSPETEKTGKN